MFEGYVSELLSYILGRYISGVSAEDLRVGFFSGSVSLENVDLRPDALSYLLQWPIDVLPGSLITKLNITVPWSGLGVDPVVMHMDGVHIVCGPSQSFSGKEDLKQLRDKMYRLEDAEIVKKQAVPSTEDAGFTARLMTKMIDTLQIRFTNVHVRYEDNVSDPLRPFAFGVTFEELVATTASELWELLESLRGDALAAELARAQASPVIHKLVSLGNMSVYLTPRAEIFGPLTTPDQRRLFAAQVPTRSAATTPLPHRYILRPVDIKMKLVMRKSDVPDLAVPKYTPSFEVGDISLSFDEDQLRDFGRLADFLYSFDKIAAFREWRPEVPVAKDPAAWWRFAIRCVSTPIKARFQRWSWAYIRRFKEHEREYIALYRAKLKQTPPLPESSSRRLFELESEHEFEHIIMFRYHAEQMSSDGATGQPTEPAASSSSVVPASSSSGVTGWISWLMGAPTPAESSKLPVVARQLTEEERKDLYRRLDYDGAAEALALVVPPPSYVHIKASFLMKHGSIVLRGADRAGVMKCVFTDLVAGYTSRPTSAGYELSLQDFTIMDLFTPGTLFPSLLERSASSEPPAQRLPLLRVTVDQKPLDGRADLVVGVAFQAVDVCYSRPVGERIMGFFSQAAAESDIESKIEAAAALASAKIEQIVDRKLDEIRSGLANRRTLSLDVDFAGPKIMLLEDPTQADTLIATCDLGHLRIKSELQPGAAVLLPPASATAASPVSGEADEREARRLERKLDRFVKRERRRLERSGGPGEWPPMWDPSSEDAGAEDEFYDQFSMTMSRMAVTLRKGRSGSGRAAAPLIDPFDVSVTLYSCIIPGESPFAQWRLTGGLSPISVTCDSTRIVQARVVVDAIWGLEEDHHAAEASLAPPPDERAQEDTGGQERSLSPLLPVSPSTSAVAGPISPSIAVAMTTTAVSAVSQASSQSPQAKLFECHISIPSVSVHVSREDGQKSLLGLSITGVTASLLSRPHDISLSASLEGLVITDAMCVHKGPAFSHLARSHDGGNMISVEGHWLTSSSPAWTGVGVVSKMDFSDLHVAINYETAEALLALWDEASATLPARRRRPAPPRRTAPPASSSPSLLLKPPPQPSGGSPHLQGSRAILAPRAPAASAAEEPRREVSAASSMRRFTVQLNHNGRELARLGMTDLSLQYELDSRRSRLDGHLGNLQVWDLTPVASLYKEVLGLSDPHAASLLTFTREAFIRDAASSPSLHDVSLNIRTGSIRVVYDHRFFQELQSYVSSGPWFSRYKGVVVAEGAAAIKKLGTSALRTRVELSVDSPVLVVPRSSGSQEALRADLGNINISNTFFDHPVTQAPMQKLAVKLSSVHLTSLSSAGSGGGGEGKIIDNIDIALDAEKPLDPAHATKRIAEVSVSASISDVAVRVSERQYALFLGVMNENIFAASAVAAQTPQVPTPTPAPAPAPAPAPTPTPAASASARLDQPKTSPLSPSAPSASEMVLVYRVDLTLSRISIGLERDEASHLALLRLDSIKLLALAYKNGTTKAQFDLSSISLEDARPHSRNKFKKLLFPGDAPADSGTGTGGGGSSSSQFSCRLAILETGATEVDVTLGHIRGVLVPDVILEIKDFVVEPFVRERASRELAHEALLALKGPVPQPPPQQPHENSSSSSSSSPLDRVRFSKAVNARVVIKNPEFWIVEDATSESSRAIIVRCPIYMSYAVSAEGLAAVRCLLNQVEIFACMPYASVSESMNPILDPLNLSVSFTETRSDPQKRILAADVELEATDMDFRMAYSDFKLLFNVAGNLVQHDSTEATAVAASASSASASAVVSQSQPSPSPPARAPGTSTVVSATPLRSGSLAAATVAQERLDKTTVKGRSFAFSMTEKWKVKLSSINVYFIDDAHNSVRPFARIKVRSIGLEGDRTNTSASLTAHASLSVDYLNVRNVMWEPLIEPWSGTLTASSGTGDPRLTVSISSTTPLEINVTETFLRNMMSTYTILAEDFYGRRTGPEFVAHSLRNDTGVELRCFLDHHKDKISTVPAGATVSLFEDLAVFGGGGGGGGATAGAAVSGSPGGVSSPGTAGSTSSPSPPSSSSSSSSELRRAMDNFGHDTLSVQLRGGWHAVHGIGVDEVQTKMYRMTPEINGISTKIVCSVRLEGGAKVLCVSSSVFVVNSSGRELDVRVSSRSLPQGTEVVLALGKSFPVPVTMATDGVVFFRPHLGRYEWSRGVPLADLVPGVTLSQLGCVDVAGTVSLHTLKVSDTADAQAEAVPSSAPLRYIHVTSPWSFVNLLPTSLELEVKSDGAVPGPLRLQAPAGESRSVFAFDIETTVQVRARVKGYEWSPYVLVSAPASLRSLATDLVMEPADSNRSPPLSLRIDNTVDSGTSRTVSFYAPYWFVNRSGYDMILTQEGSDKSIVLEFAGDRLDGGGGGGGAGGGGAGSPMPASAGGAGAGSASAAAQSPPGISPSWGVRRGSTTNVSPLFSAAAAPMGLNTFPEDSPDATWMREVKPVMFSFPNFAIGYKTCLKVQRSAWSKGFTIDSPGTVGSVELAESDGAVYELGVQVSLGVGRYQKTKVVTIVPRFVLWNHCTDLVLQLRQNQVVSRQYVHTLPPKRQMMFHWTSDDCQRLAHLRIEGPQWLWSPAFALDVLGEQVVRIPLRGEDGTASGSFYFARVEVALRGATAVVHLFPQDPDCPAPYRIQNFLERQVFVRQKAAPPLAAASPGQPATPQVAAEWEPLGSKLETPFAWSDLTCSDRLLEVMVGGSVASISLDEIKDHVSLHPSDSPHVAVHLLVTVDGPTKLLSILSEDRYRAFTAAVLDDPRARDDESLMHLEVRLPRVSVSLLTHAPREILHASVLDVEYAYTETALEGQTELKVSRLQVDNQLQATRFPVALVVKPVEGQPALHASVVRALDASPLVESFKYLSVLLQQVEVSLDDEVLSAVAGMAEDALASGASDLEDTLRAQRPGRVLPSRQVYFDLLELHPVAMTASFARSGRRLRGPVGVVLDALGSAATTFSRAPLRLNALVLENPFESRNQLLDRVGKFYYSQLVAQVYTVVGSLEVLGNPVALLSHVGTGVHDFFYLPAQGLVKSPFDFAEGVGRGSASLVRNTVQGTFGAASAITGSLAGGLSSLSMDDDYTRAREFSKRKEARGLGEGLLEGGKELGQGIFDGVTGIFSQPVQGAQDEGVAGFFKGLGRGLIGVAVKPVAGVLDLGARVTQGISNEGVEDGALEQQRIRPPRVFQGGVIQVYDRHLADGQELLHTVDRGRYAEARYLLHQRVANGFVFVLSATHALLIEEKSRDVEWSLDLSKVTSDPVVTSTGLRLTEDRVIPCSDATARFLAKKLKREN